jgi:HlyD family secretion protein
MNAQKRRRIFVIAVGIAVALLIVYGFLPKPIPVDVATAGRGPLRVTVEEEGRTRVKDRFVVSAPVPGFLRRITLEVGDPVSKGMKVAMIDPLRSTALDPRSRAEAVATVAAAEATLDAAKEKARAATADAEYAREREARMKKLAVNGYISTDELEQAEAAAKKAEAILLSGEAAVTAAQADLERARSLLRHSATGVNGSQKETVIVHAPVGGRVLLLHRESEGVVNSGDPLLDIGNPSGLEVRVEVLSADAVKIKKGMPVLFERWGGDKPLEGKVHIVEPSGFTKISSLGVEEQRVNVIVDFTSPVGTWRRLGDGYRLEASFIIWESKDVLQVPASTLFRSGKGWSVFTVKNSRAHLRPVEVGRRNGLAAEIVSGIMEGEVVIIHPDDMIHDNSRVSSK